MRNTQEDSERYPHDMHRDAGETQQLTDNLRGRLREARTAPDALRALLDSLQDAGVRGAGLAGWTAGHWTSEQWNAGPGTVAAPDLRGGTWTVTPLAFTDPPAALYLPAPAAGTPAAHLEALLTLTGQALRRIAREDSPASPDQSTTQPADLHTTARRADLAEARLQQLTENGPVAVAAGTTDGQLLMVMTPRLQAGACVWTPPQLGVPRKASRFGFSVRHIRGA